MNDHIIMDDKTKRNMGILSLLPLLSWFIVLVYYLLTLSPVMAQKRREAHEALVTLTSNNYDTLFMLGAISAVISAIVLVYFVIHIARIKAMNGATKIMWILILSAIVPLGFPLFWYLEIRNERKHMPIHPDIA